MRNLIQPITKEVGIITIRGRDYHMQTISYGSQNQVHVFRNLDVLGLFSFSFCVE